MESCLLCQSNIDGCVARKLRALTTKEAFISHDKYLQYLTKNKNKNKIKTDYEYTELFFIITTKLNEVSMA